MSTLDADQTRTLVREHYANISTKGGSCAPGCCGTVPADQSLSLGYSEADLAAVPEGADLGLGCGNPNAIAALKPGETVLDLGSGGGFDCFLAARAVGPTGKVIGVDMTPEMITRARENARKVKATNVDFRLGEIEHLPVADGTVDAILSNCVINLSPEKEAVFSEALRVLKPGGRLAISDVVAIAPIPPELQTQAAALAGCISGASPLDELKDMLTRAGFVNIEVTIKPNSAAIVDSWLEGASKFIASATIEARRADPSAPKQEKKTSSCCEPSC
ncbi:MAG TPA: arsenite methyltransferase, partial [Kofleriaceae bacterium]|nr:arsenite methyltransferase [Kofleriaceae bacterium]